MWKLFMKTGRSWDEEPLAQFVNEETGEVRELPERVVSNPNFWRRKSTKEFLGEDFKKIKRHWKVLVVADTLIKGVNE